MNLKRLVMLIAITAGLIAVAVVYLQTRSQPLAITAPPAVSTDKTTSHSDELRRCRELGEAATRDPQCRATWKADRDRFLGK